MSKKIPVEITFQVVATIKIDLDQLNSEDYDLSNPEQLKEAIDNFVLDNAYPGQYYSSYNRSSAMVCIRDFPARYEIVGIDSDDAVEGLLISIVSEDED